VAIVHNVVKESGWVLPHPSAVYHAYASTDTPWVMRGWVLIFKEVEVSHLVEISMLMMKAPNRISNPCSHNTTASLVITPCDMN
jgi:hypothetical protein